MSMLPLLKVGPAAQAFGRALVPPTTPQSRNRPSPNLFDMDALGSAPRTMAAAEASAWQAEQTWRGAPSLGRVVGAAAVLGMAAWMSMRKGDRR